MISFKGVGPAGVLRLSSFDELPLPFLPPLAQATAGAGAHQEAVAETRVAGRSYCGIHDGLENLGRWPFSHRCRHCHHLRDGIEWRVQHGRDRQGPWDAWRWSLGHRARPQDREGCERDEVTTERRVRGKA